MRNFEGLETIESRREGKFTISYSTYNKSKDMNTLVSFHKIQVTGRQRCLFLKTHEMRVSRMGRKIDVLNLQYLPK